MTSITDRLQKASDLVLGMIPQLEPTTSARHRTKLVAHRGAWDRKIHLENTIPAFEQCLNKNIWAIEFDIRFTEDNVPVVHHDATTERVFGKDIMIETTPFSILREELPQIPTLSEVISLFGKRLHFMIEIKAHPSKEQSLILKEILKPLKAIEDYHLMSLDPHHFFALHNFPRKTFVSIARTNIHTIFKKSLELDIGGFTGHYLLLTERMKEACHDQDIKVGTGFPPNKNLLYREMHRDIDWVFTNRALRLETHLNDEV